MNLLAQVLQDLRRHEGVRLKVYKDTEGIWTNGVGHTGPDVFEGMKDITPEVAEGWLLEDTLKAVRLARSIFASYDSLDQVRKSVLINMAFNLGNRLRTFKKMIAAVEAKDFNYAALEMLNSKWAVQVKGRSKELAARMSSGKIPVHLQYRSTNVKGE